MKPRAFHKRRQSKKALILPVILTTILGLACLTVLQLVVLHASYLHHAMAILLV